MNKEQLKSWWDYIQSLLDLDGDLWMGLFTAFILVRILGVVLRGWPALTTSEAGTYGSAVLAFAYSNKGTPKS